MEVPFCDVLNLLCSPSDRICSRSVRCLFAYAYTHSDVFLSKLPELEVLINSLCARQSPHWGTISVICMCISVASSVAREAARSRILSLIDISATVTRTAFSVANETEYNCPVLWPLCDAICTLTSWRFTLSVEHLIAIADHCVIGFLPLVSLVPVLVDAFPDRFPPLADAGAETYACLARPLSSSDDSVVSFFLALWAWMMSTLADRPQAVDALATQADRLVLLLGRPETEDLARALIDCVRYTPGDRADVMRRAGEAGDRAIARMRGNRGSLVKKKIDEEEIPETQTRAKKTYATLSAPYVELILAAKGKGKKKKWAKRSLTFSEEAGILFWTEPSANLMEKGGGFHCSEIKDVSMTQPGTAEQGKENVMKVVTTKGELFIAFPSYNAANQWKNTLHSRIAKLAQSKPADA